jgi:hypothetical protein
MEKDVMSVLESLEESVIRELRTLNQKSSLSATEIKAATDAMCLLLKIKMYREGGSELDMDGNSFRTWPGTSWNSMNSMTRSPVTGRYVSRDMGYSSHSINDKMIAKLETAYDDAQSQYEREEIRKEIDRLRNRSN